MQEYLKDKSFVIKMKSPLELFHTDIQTRYIGQVQCDCVYDSKEMYKGQFTVRRYCEVSYLCTFTNEV